MGSFLLVIGFKVGIQMLTRQVGSVKSHLQCRLCKKLLMLEKANVMKTHSDIVSSRSGESILFHSSFCDEERGGGSRMDSVKKPLIFETTYCDGDTAVTK